MQNSRTKEYRKEYNKQYYAKKQLNKFVTIISKVDNIEDKINNSSPEELIFKIYSVASISDKKIIEKVIRVLYKDGEFNSLYWKTLTCKIKLLAAIQTNHS